MLAEPDDTSTSSVRCRILYLVASKPQPEVIGLLHGLRPAWLQLH